MENQKKANFKKAKNGSKATNLLKGKDTRKRANPEKENIFLLNIRRDDDDGGVARRGR
jgi:hypothetical protein